MKFVHIADMHFDTSFTQLSNSENLGNLRRLEQKKVFKKVIEYIKNNNIEYFFIAGDLYEHNYIRESTIEYINNLFKEIPNTKIFITPGNHDPYLKNSFYNKFRWNDNVHIFGPNISVVNCGDVNIYGFGFDDFYYTNSELDSFELNNKSAINILITHATLNGTNNVEKQYNAIQKYTLDRIGFDSSFIIFDTSDQKTVVKECLKELKIDDKLFTDKSVLYEISNAKNEMLEPIQYKAKYIGDFRKETIARIYELYQKKLKENNAIDFDDIINYTIKILMENEDVLEYYSNKFIFFRFLLHVF